ncbi:hypothetical protein ACSV9I_06310 [Rhizobium sp. G187]|uniref:hypothetical protein n=1 Tax=unclassified Rhizobium TaxID=2613769 RepID=UPI0006B9D8E6|nr:hypothetical protein [Rhizobium sp. AAP43]KPF46724.1 hypothetical protein IP76_02190 [Rhizobium sp. AAP43]
MRIESGLSSNSYQSRHVPSTVSLEEAAPEATANNSGRLMNPSTFSSTLLSTQLSAALWTVEGSRTKGTSPTAVSAASKDFSEMSRIQMVEAAYREHDVPSPYGEF